MLPRKKTLPETLVNLENKVINAAASQNMDKNQQSKVQQKAIPGRMLLAITRKDRKGNNHYVTMFWIGFAFLPF
jgi:hypothetical protein